MDIRGAINVRSIIGVLVVLIVGLAVLPVILSSVATAQACITDAAASTMVGLIPLFYVIALLLAVIYWAVGQTKEK